MEFVKLVRHYYNDLIMFSIIEIPLGNREVIITNRLSNKKIKFKLKNDIGRLNLSDGQMLYIIIHSHHPEFKLTIDSNRDTLDWIRLHVVSNEDSSDKKFSYKLNPKVDDRIKAMSKALNFIVDNS
jgi:hypothetical protein